MGASISKRVEPCEGSLRFETEYKRGRILGAGGFSRVWSCKQRSTGKTFACKVIKKDLLDTPEHRETLASEVEVMERIRGASPHLIQLQEVIETESEVCIIMEKCSGGDLYFLLKDYGAMPEPAVKLVFQQLALAVNCLHNLGIIHRDIKIRNVLFDTSPTNLYTMRSPRPLANAPKAKLSDFGLSVAVPEKHNQVTGSVGTLRFTAPEVLQGLPYSFEVDMWALGVVLCTMLTGKSPFAGRGHEDKADIVRAIVEGKVDFRQICWRHVSPGAQALVRQLLQVDPRRRLTSQELVNHPWLSGHEEVAENE